MKDNILFASATISSALSFIEGLIPILQVILLAISLICTLAGLFNTIIERVKNGEDVSKELDKGVNEVKDLTDKLSDKINEIDRGNKDDNK